MFTRHVLNKFTSSLLAGVGLAGLCGIAAAQSTPSAKATFAYSTLVSLTSCNKLDAAGCTGNTDTGWRPFLKQQIKLAN